MSVQLSGCFSGLNGCDKQYLYDEARKWGISRPVYFTIMPCITGAFCSLVVTAPFQNGVLSVCEGGGIAATKIAIASGRKISGWVVFFRILLCAVYMGGGNSLGTEGPIIHLSACCATNLISALGIKRPKLLSIFGVVGAAAGISAGFNVLVAGICFVIEELTRTLSAKISLMVALAAGWAVFIRHNLEHVTETFVHLNHPSMVPDKSLLGSLSEHQSNILLLLCIPVGILSGCFGWAFASLAWNLQSFLNPVLAGKKPSVWMARSRSVHLAVIGAITGLIGSFVYEVTNVNGVWGTTVAQVPVVVESGLSFGMVLLIFFGKFTAIILNTAAGGPGGQLVPALVAGGYLGVAAGRLVGGDDAFCAASAVIGMGSMFASMLHLPVTGIVIMLELTRASDIMVHVVISSFISSTVCYNLPHGHHSYVHTRLKHDSQWQSLGGQEFIETDAHEKNAEKADRLAFFAKIGFMLNNPIIVQQKVMDAWRQVMEARRLWENFGDGMRNRRISMSHKQLCDIWIRDRLVQQNLYLMATICESWKSLCIREPQSILRTSADVPIDLQLTVKVDSDAAQEDAIAPRIPMFGVSRFLVRQHSMLSVAGRHSPPASSPATTPRASFYSPRFQSAMNEATFCAKLDEESWL